MVNICFPTKTFHRKCCVHNLITGNPIKSYSMVIRHLRRDGDMSILKTVPRKFKSAAITVKKIFHQSRQFIEDLLSFDDI